MTDAVASPGTKASPGPAGPDWLNNKLAKGQIVIIDGGTGTELEARGARMDSEVWSAAAVLEHGDILRQIHIDYIRAGAEVVITNTFSAGRQMMEPAGMGDKVVAVHQAAASRAREAIDEAAAEHPVALAGSICEWLRDPQSRFVEEQAFEDAMAEQANLLAEAGVDLLTIEMGADWRRAGIAVKAALATGLPVWAGLSCKAPTSGEGLRVFDLEDTLFQELVDGLPLDGVGLVSVMHSSVTDSAAGIDAVRKTWTGPIGVYPESGDFVMPHWQFVDIIDPELLVEAAKAWQKQGVGLIGGCCGLGPTHIMALRQAFPFS